MKSSYKRLGDYIHEVNTRNKELHVIPLLGVSITKKFIPSIANIVGTDMSTYKLIEKNQFAYGPVTSRNGDKISIALSEEHDNAMVSQAYTVFDVNDVNEVLPEYLMMWFRRTEFDRYARFMSHGSAREIFSWAELCDTLLPIPSPEKQREIVKEYKVIQNRVALNNQLIAKLEEMAQTIYKQWFVDFEFPDEKGKPYKSNGGEMEWCEELEKDVPLGWEITNVKDFCKDMKSGGTPSRGNDDFWNKNDIPWVKTGEIKNNIVIKAEEYISKSGLNGSSAKLLPIDTVLMSMYGVNAGEIGILKFEATTNQACCGMICRNREDAAFLYFHFLLNQEFISSQATGGAQENLSKDFIEKIKLLKPNNNLISQSKLSFIINNKELYTRQNLKLNELSDLVLANMTKVESEIETVEN